MGYISQFTTNSSIVDSSGDTLVLSEESLREGLRFKLMVLDFVGTVKIAKVEDEYILELDRNLLFPRIDPNRQGARDLLDE